MNPMFLPHKSNHLVGCIASCFLASTNVFFKNCFHTSGSCENSCDVFYPEKCVFPQIIKVPRKVEGGGPLISLEVADEEDTLSVVWMSINTRENPIVGYFLALNGKQCPQMISPEADSARCKAVIEGCVLDRDYRVQVFAVPSTGKSNCLLHLGTAKEHASFLVFQKDRIFHRTRSCCIFRSTSATSSCQMCRKKIRSRSCTASSW